MAKKKNITEGLVPSEEALTMKEEAPVPFDEAPFVEKEDNVLEALVPSSPVTVLETFEDPSFSSPFLPSSPSREVLARYAKAKLTGKRFEDCPVPPRSEWRSLFEGYASFLKHLSVKSSSEGFNCVYRDYMSDRTNDRKEFKG